MKHWIVTLGTAGLMALSVPASAGLVAHWAGNGNTLDSAGAANGSWYGTPAYAAGHSGQAFDFSNNSNYVELGAPPSLQFTSSFSLSAWFRVADTSGQRMILNYEDGYEVSVNNGRLQYALYGVSQPWTWVDTGLTATMGQWTGFSLSYDAGSHEVKVYDASGTLVSTHTGPTQLAAASTVYPATTLRIGARHGSSPAPADAASYFYGQIDDVRLYDQVIVGMPADGSTSVPEPAVLGLVGLAWALMRRQFRCIPLSRH